MRRHVNLRKASQQDREILCDIQVSAIRELGKSYYSESELDAWSSGLCPERHAKWIAERHVIVAELESEVVGFGSLDRATGEICAIYVRPAHARHGIGTNLLDGLVSEARRLGFGEVRCESSLSAVSFYENAGFQSGRVRKHRFRDGREIDCIPMRRALEGVRDRGAPS